MKKILILANNDGGLYKFRKELIEELVSVFEVYISLPNGEFIPELKQIGCHFIETNIDRRSTNIIEDAKLVVKYVKIVKEVQPDIVLTYTIKPNIYGGIACSLTKTKYLSNITGLGTAMQKKGLIRNLVLFLYKVGLRKSSCVFFQNKFNKSIFEQNKLISENSVLVPGSGVNIHEYQYENYPIDSNPVKILFIGRLMKAKGIDELLDVAQDIKDKKANIEFHLLGFSEEDNLKRIKDYHKKGIVIYHGFQKSTKPFLKQSHAVILPSHHEGLANVLLEAASIGRPILASRVPGCVETFDEGLSGFGFEVRNSYSLLKTVIKFAELPYQKKVEMGANGRLKVETEFNREIVIASYLDEINKVIKEN